MWRWIKRWLSKTPQAPVDIAKKLDAATLEQALKDAQFLHSQGVSVRELFPGEVPPDEPEIGESPML